MLLQVEEPASHSFVDGILRSSLVASSPSGSQIMQSGSGSTFPLMEFQAVSKGQFRLSPDLLYDGDMKDGKPNGHGRIISLSQKQLVYDGSVKSGIYDGQGCRYMNGFLYEKGVFANGLITEGIRYCSNKSVYNGSFENDVFDGEGTIVLPNGFFLRGFFSQGGLSCVSPCSVSIPSAKSPSELDARFITITYNFIQIQYNNVNLFFYFNGDVLVGTMKDDHPENGHFYYYSDLAFTKMVIGDVKGLPTLRPKMVLEADNKSKYFEMVQ